MKTPKEWLSLLILPRPETICFDAMEQWISTIQQDAFESGWKQGVEDSVDMQSKGVDPQRAVDAWNHPEWWMPPPPTPPDNQKGGS